MAKKKSQSGKTAGQLTKTEMSVAIAALLVVGSIGPVLFILATTTLNERLMYLSISTLYFSVPCLLAGMLLGIAKLIMYFTSKAKK